MENLKEFKNIAQYLQAVQIQKLEKIIELISIEGYLPNPEKLIERTKKPSVTHARRIIAFIARYLYNIEGNVIAKRLNLDRSQVFAIVASTFGNVQVETDYRNELAGLIDKLKCI
ncbi:hypothetical protein ACFOG5_09710 [Pedobacter fastidiosus]|uniref:Chromosomal replication initiator DnaA C-terminal domain-containing protein n=1 Tax=Pedobacter fastidiosus TaxID=2765361 RepID=A0ABR7KXY9_9SPHI|nr:hypothetical protein [Pedobacter fastidiosus]MBC6112991.1 hypothetical protein [Pedobacter fastidiosus]